jgi:hypothetical protein
MLWGLVFSEDKFSAWQKVNKECHRMQPTVLLHVSWTPDHKVHDVADKYGVQMLHWS